MNTSTTRAFLSTSTTVPAENYRFIPGPPTILTNWTTNSTNTTHPNLKSPPFNGTGYYIEDEAESGLSELQTLFLACIATFLPLIVSLFVGFGIRVLWRKYRRYRDCNNYDGDILHREESSEPMSKPLCSHLLNDQIKCSETQLSITGDDMEICDGTITTITNGPQHTRSTSHSSTNGSIITMTLKNNHLIVETEERNDIEEDSRETTMKYSPGARDGVFVVEVQQGSKRSPGSGGPSIIDTEPSINTTVSDQCALVHNPPDRYSDEDTLEECDEDYVETTSPSRETPSSLLQSQCRTGLTQSNSSLSSSSAQTYRYGNQQGYESGYYGYPIPICSNYNVGREEQICNSDSKDNIKIAIIIKPKIISEVFKNSFDMKSSRDVMFGVSKDEDVDVDAIQEEQNRLGNAIGVEVNGKNNAPDANKEPEMSQSANNRKCGKLQKNDISLSLDVAETNIRSVDYED